MPMLADQVTAVVVPLVVPVTVSVNCCVPPEATVAEVGEMVTATVAGAVMVIEAVADLVGSATLVTVTVAVVLTLTVGAV